MEMHIIEIVRFIVCIMSVFVAILLMIRADDNTAMRRLTVILAAVLIFFNRQIGYMTYLLIGSTLESIIAVMGLTFVLMLFLFMEGPSMMLAVSRSKMVADFLPVMDFRYNDSEIISSFLMEI